MPKVEEKMSRAALLKSASMDDEFLSYVRFVEPSDAEFICNLRSDQTLNRHISATSSDVDAQRCWIDEYKKREAVGNEFYFVIRHQEKDYGVVRMYDFKDNSFSWGSWIILPSRPNGLVTYSAVMIYEMGFDVLGFDQSHFDVRVENEKVINFHLRSGAIQMARNDLDQNFVFPISQWTKFREVSIPQIRAHQVWKHRI